MVRSRSPPLEGRGRGGVCNILSAKKILTPPLIRLRPPSLCSPIAPSSQLPTWEGSSCARFLAYIEHTLTVARFFEQG